MRREVEGVNHTVEFFDKKINDPFIEDNERLKVVRIKARQLEERAQRDELVLRNKHDATVENEMAVNDLYLDAITAKLKLLDRI
jgi:hypothetical protein